jgi:uncharacterized protein involved in exopolysaccharide biosynthesis
VGTKGEHILNQPGKFFNTHSNADAILYASALDNLIAERNPIQAIVGDIQHMVKVLTNLGQTRKIAAARIEQLEKQVESIEQQIASVNPQVYGQRFNKLR